MTYDELNAPGQPDEAAYHLPLTPRDLRYQTFPGRVGGYDRAAVQATLAQAADQLELLLRDRHEQQTRLAELEARVAAYVQAEDEIRRTVVAAERIGQELRRNAERECELLTAQATAERDALLREARARALELDAEHRARQADLDRAHAERLAALDREYQAQAADCAGRLKAMQHEHAQFLSSYRALIASFSELAARHTPPELPAAPLDVNWAEEKEEQER